MLTEADARADRPGVTTGVADGAAPTDPRRRIPSLRVSYGFFNRCVMAADGVTLAAVGLALAGADAAARPFFCALIASLCAALIVAGLHAAGAYRVEHYRMVRRSLLDLLGATVAAAAMLTLVRLRTASGPPTLSGVAIVGVLLLAVLLLERFVVRALYRVLRRRGTFRRRVALVGDGAAADALADRLRDAAAEGELMLVGVFTAVAGPAGGAAPPGVAELRRIAHEAHVDLIVLAVPPTAADDVFETAAQVQWISADIVLPVDTARFVPDDVVEVAGRAMLRLASHPLRGSQGLVKMAEDYAIALVALAVLSPLMVVVAVLIRLEGDGPVLFRQQRIGVNGRPFEILKFRTMASDDGDDGSLAVRRGDPRITRTGAFLRRTSLDELPQLFNVLRGEMSVVGPRPHVPGMRVEGEAYSELVRTYAARHRIKPGITGWAQVNGMRAGITSAERARRGVELDLFYIRNWSLKLDLKIVLLTLAANMIGPEAP